MRQLWHRNKLDPHATTADEVEALNCRVGHVDLERRVPTESAGC
jgi:hypothetical protein